MTPITPNIAPLFKHREGLVWLTCDMCGSHIAAVFPREEGEPVDESYICFPCTGYHVKPSAVSATVAALAEDPIYPEELRDHWRSLIPAMKIAEEYMAKYRPK